jgi:hypothetical protein
VSLAGAAERGSSRYPNGGRDGFENLEVGSSSEEIIEQYDVTREQIQAVLEFAARSLDAPPDLVSASADQQNLSSRKISIVVLGQSAWGLVRQHLEATHNPMEHFAVHRLSWALRKAL